MPNIVIAGAGPIGLYTAILLRKRYPLWNVTVLDRRIGHFNRPGVIATEALNAINESFSLYNIDQIHVSESGCHPSAIHIRDLQNALYKKAESAGVTFINSDYAAVENNEVQIEDDGADALPCDLLIDCTGNDRVITGEMLNAQNISDNPIKNHFIAYIYVNETDDAPLLQSSAEITPQKLSNFRSNTRWTEFVAPEMDTPRRWRGPFTQDGVHYTNKYCLYFEIPSDLPREKYADYLQKLLFLKYGKEIHFTPSTDLGAFNRFEVSPKELKRVVGTIESVPVIALGDALISPEYRYGTGIENGVAGAIMLTNALSWDETKVIVNERAWRDQPIPLPRYSGGSVTAVIESHKTKITKDYESKKRVLQNAREKAYTEFSQDPSKASGFDSILFAKMRGDEYKEQGDKNFKTQCNDSLPLYLEAIDCYERAAIHSTDPIAIEASRDKQIKTLSNLGKVYLKIQNVDASINAFEDAIFLARDCNILEMLHEDKLPKSFCVAADIKIASFDSNHREKKAFLERVITCLSKAGVDSPSYIALLEETEEIIANIEKTQSFRASAGGNNTSSHTAGDKGDFSP